MNGPSIFFCQNATCRKPLDIDDSISNLDTALLQQVTVQDLEEKLKEIEIEKSKESKNSEKTRESKNNEKQFEKTMKFGEENALIHSKLAKQFELISETTGIDHPLCKECAQKVLQELETLLIELTKENNSYRTFVKQLEDEEIEEGELDEELNKLKNEESELVAELSRIENERKTLKEEMKLLEQEYAKVSAFEEKYLENCNKFQTELIQFQEESASVKTQLLNAKEQLEKFKTTNIFNDTFHIWHDGHFGTINTFRLGRLPSQPVDWHEINAAWGQAALLLCTIAKKLNYQFLTYNILPLGSSSKVQKNSDKSTYELYGFSDVSLGKLFWYRRFDTGMVAFLTCLKEIAEFAQSKDKTFRLPYKIEKDKINEFSIKYEFTNEENWTKALKYMLTNLKFIVAWLAKQEEY